MASFTGVELYRSTTDLSVKTRSWCDTNATLLYSGTAETYDDTGLTAGELHYYKVFSVYTEDGQTVYSNGVATTCVTGIIPLVVTAIADTSNTIQLTFDTDMSDPTGKEDEFSVSIGGGSSGDYQEWSSYPESPLLTSLYPYQVVLLRDGNPPALLLSIKPWYHQSDTGYWPDKLHTSGIQSWKQYNLLDNTWSFIGNYTVSQWSVFNGISNLIECNYDVYNEVSYTTIYKPKTTSSSTLLTITDIYLDANIKQYKITLAEAILSTDAVIVSYTQGTVKSAAGVDLEDFSETVTNNI